MNKTQRVFCAGICTVITGLFAVFAANAQEEESRGFGWNAVIDLNMDTFNLNSYAFDRKDIRPSTAQDKTEIRWLINNRDFWTDSQLSLGYNSEYFGGSFRVKERPDLKAWAQFSFLRVTLGNDIESVYADPLDSDIDLRIYTGRNDLGGVEWTGWINPDNITQSEGFLIEAFLSPFTIALSAGDFGLTTQFTQIRNTNDYAESQSTSFRYGGRVGYDLGGIGKVNASYMIEQYKTAAKYVLKTNTQDMVPGAADAQYFDHFFGVYGSFALTPDFGLTIGYNGVLTQYLAEYFTVGLGDLETGYPVVFKNGLNVNARYRVNEDFTLRTDHCLTLWKDKDYNLFETASTGMRNYGLLSAAVADDYAEVDHFIIWNGLGASYALSGKAVLSAYVHNLFSRYQVSGSLPSATGGRTGTYEMTRDQIGVELKFAWRLGARAEAFFKVVVEDSITTRSQDLNTEDRDRFFIDRIDNIQSNPRPEPVQTRDNLLTVRIPIGITLVLQ